MKLNHYISKNYKNIYFKDMKKKYLYSQKRSYILFRTKTKNENKKTRRYESISQRNRIIYILNTKPFLKIQMKPLLTRVTRDAHCNSEKKKTFKHATKDST